MPLNYQTVMRQIEDLTKRAEKLRAIETAKIAAVIKSIKAQMSKHGLTLAHLGSIGSSVKAKVSAGATKAMKATPKLKANDKRLKVKPKYRNKKTGDTWAGRGKPPRWMAAEMKAGKKKEDFLIK